MNVVISGKKIKDRLSKENLNGLSSLRANNKAIICKDKW